MSRLLSLRLVALLIVLAATLALSVVSAPEGTYTGLLWPVGLGAGVLISSPPWLRHWIGAVVAVVAIVTIYLAGFPLTTSIGYGVTFTLAAVTAQRLVTTSAGLVRVSFATNDELISYLFASWLSCNVAGAGAALTAFLTDFGTPWEVYLAASLSTLATNLVLLGLFREPGHYYGVAATWERALNWLITLGLAFVAFTLLEGNSVVFLVFAVLGWAAFRLSMRDSMWLLLCVSVMALTTFRLEIGPFINDPGLTWLPAELSVIPVHVFTLAAALVVVPFASSVGLHRQSASEALMERARSARLVQAARGIAIIGTDQVGRINMFNPGAEQILGYTPHEVYGHSMRMFFSQAEIARQAEDLGTDPTYLSVLPAMLKLSPGLAREWQFTRKDGQERTLATILSPIYDELGSFVGYVITADDVTNRVRTQEALVKALETERRALARMTEVDQAKDDFVSAVSHELRTPITNIIGYLELLIDEAYGPHNDDQKRALSRVEVNSRRLLTLIDDLLTLSSVENMHDLLDPEELDLREIAIRAEDLTRPSRTNRQIEVHLTLAQSPVLVEGDVSQLERIAINLTTNAIKFTPDGGLITLQVFSEADRAVLEVIDTGVGIPEDEQQQLFSRFFRASYARQDAVQGSGLGLSIVKTIAERHGGSVSARSVEGSGSTFRVELPLQTSPSAADSDPP